MTDPRTKCTICRSPKSKDVAEAVLAGESDAVIAERFGFSRSAVQRHNANHSIKNALQKSARVQPRRRRKKADADEKVDSLPTITRLLHALEELRDQEQQRGRSTAVAQISEKILRALELQEKMSGSFGRPDSQTTSAQSEYAKVLRSWSTENIRELASAHACDNCGAKRWISLGDHPPTLYFRGEPPKAPASFEEQHWANITDSRRTVINGKPYWLTPADKLPD